MSDETTFKGLEHCGRQQLHLLRANNHVVEIPHPVLLSLLAFFSGRFKTLYPDAEHRIKLNRTSGIETADYRISGYDAGGLQRHAKELNADSPVVPTRPYASLTRSLTENSQGPFGESAWIT